MSGEAKMATYTWIGASGPFTATSFWRVNGTLTGGLPGSADTALFPGSGTYDVSGATGVNALLVTDPLARIGVQGSIGFSSAGSVQNAGTLLATFGTTLGATTVGQGLIAFSNTGRIESNATSDLTIVAATSTDALGTIDMNGGRLALGGAIANAGHTLSAAAFDASSLSIQGSISGGTLLADGALRFDTYYTNPAPLLLDGVTIRGSFAGFMPTFIQGGLTVRNAVGTGPGTLEIGTALYSGENQPGITVLDSATLDNFTLNLRNFAYGSEFPSLTASQTVTLGQNLMLQTFPVSGLPAVGGSSNLLAGNALVAAGNMLLGANLKISATNFTNLGTIGDTPGSGEFFTVSSTHFANAGSIGLTSYATVAAPDFANAGYFSARNFSIQGAGNGAFVAGTVVTNTGTLAVTGGTLTVLGHAAGNGTIDIAAGGTADLRGLYGDQHFAMHGTGNTLRLGTVGGSNILTGFAPGNSLVLAGTPVQVVFNAGTLTLSNNAIPLASFILPDVPANAVFQAEIGTDTVITETIPCFAAGTKLLTARGEIPVEDLRVGDMLPGLHSGRLQPVIWLGHRRAVATHHARPETVWPVRIRAGAIAANVPGRDLLLSPEHAVYLYGVLVPARHLLNGTTIVQEPCAAITYYHVELPAHDLVLAAGLASESYLDTGNRADFANAGQVVAVHPTFGADANAIWQVRACAPQCRGGSRLAAIRQLLDRRAGEMRAARAA